MVKRRIRCVQYLQIVIQRTQIVLQEGLIFGVDGVLIPIQNVIFVWVILNVVLIVKNQ